MKKVKFADDVNKNDNQNQNQKKRNRNKKKKNRPEASVEDLDTNRLRSYGVRTKKLRRLIYNKKVEKRNNTTRREKE